LKQTLTPEKAVYNATADGQRGAALGELKRAVRGGNRKQALELTRIICDVVAQYS
jgi:hypothetical protein